MRKREASAEGSLRKKGPTRERNAPYIYFRLSFGLRDIVNYKWRSFAHIRVLGCLLYRESCTPVVALKFPFNGAFSSSLAPGKNTRASA